MQTLYNHLGEWVHVHNITCSLFFNPLLQPLALPSSSNSPSLICILVNSNLSSCSWHRMFTFVEVIGFLYVTHLCSIYFPFCSLSPFTFAFSTPHLEEIQTLVSFYPSAIHLFVPYQKWKTLFGISICIFALFRAILYFPGESIFLSVFQLSPFFITE